MDRVAKVIDKGFLRVEMIHELRIWQDEVQYSVHGIAVIGPRPQPDTGLADRGEMGPGCPIRGLFGWIGTRDPVSVEGLFLAASQRSSRPGRNWAPASRSGRNAWAAQHHMPPIRESADLRSLPRLLSRYAPCVVPLRLCSGWARGRRARLRAPRCGG